MNGIKYVGNGKHLQRQEVYIPGLGNKFPAKKTPQSSKLARKFGDIAA
jgi:hypothetical protein